MLRFLFPYKRYPMSVDAMLLVMRILFGGLLLWHGLVKVINFGDIVTTFPNPLGIGSRLSLYLVIFAEVACSMGVIVGAFYRLALIPLIFSMLVAFFIVHSHDGFAMKELALIFLIMLVVMFLMGAGAYSLDNITASLLNRNEADKLSEIQSARPEKGTANESRQGIQPPTDGEPRQ